MAVTLTLTGKTPGNTQFGLDTFTEHYKCDATADVVLTDAGVPQMASAHPDFPFMFVTARYVSETGESASALDLAYTGCLSNPEVEGGLPAAQGTLSTSVQTASSQCAIAGLSPSQPFNLQFYAKVSTYSFFSYSGPSPGGFAPDPVGDPIPITLSLYDCTFLSGGTLEEFIANFFVIRTTDVISSEEVVAGKYWRNTETKTKFYAQPIFGP